MKKISPFFALAILCFVFVSCSNSQAGSPVFPTSPSAYTSSKVKTTEELRMELAQQEAANPIAQLVASGTIEENKVLIQKPDFFHHSIYQTQGYIIHGIIRNKATLAQFKDATVQINFYTETQTDLGGNNFVVYKYFNPNSETSFDIKVNPPPVMRTFSIQVIGAMATR
jgi:hypothetical protein